MKATATFKEITDIVENKFNVRLSICKEDDKSIKVTYRKLFVSAEIILRIEKITEQEVILSYASGRGMDLLIQGAVITLGENIPGSISIDILTHKITARINEIEPLRKVFDKISLNDLYVEDDGFEADFSLKAL